jgi:ATP-binding cassette subfamily G (WHITE) protein 2 (PDR)
LLARYTSAVNNTSFSAATMSLVGNFTSNGDATSMRSGAAAGQQRQNHHIDDSAAPDPAIGLHRTSTSMSQARKRSTSGARPAGATQEMSDSNTLPPSNGNSTSQSKEHEDKVFEDSSADDEEDKRREAEVHTLARKLTKQSSSYSDQGVANPFLAPEDSRLNPHSEHFNARAWAKSVLNFHLQDPEAHPLRTSGIAFRNLNVFGFGASTDYQKSVGNVILEIVGNVRAMLGIGQKRRIDILRDFEGVVHAGELLVVLGPPGSGCSTLLKTISGETHGLNIDPHSYMNYQGEFCLERKSVSRCGC